MKSMLKCPYCTGDVPDEAYVCPNCGKDIYPFRPQLKRIAVLERRVGELETRLSRHCGEPTEESEKTPPQTRDWLGMLALPLGILLLAHLLITQAWDAGDWVLYATTVTIPLVFGFLVERRYQIGLPGLAGVALSLAVVAVLGMSGITYLLDGGDWLPHSSRDWREFFNFGASMAFAYVSGALACRAYVKYGVASMEAWQISLSQGGGGREFGMASRIEFLTKALPAILTGAASLVSGLSRFVN